jgi:hypothetical protein
LLVEELAAVALFEETRAEIVDAVCYQFTLRAFRATCETFVCHKLGSFVIPEQLRQILSMSVCNGPLEVSWIEL